MTAGLFQSELAAIPGMSEALVGGMITYTEDIKVQQLGVRQEIISELWCCFERMCRRNGFSY